MQPTVFEFAITKTERLHTCALKRAAIGIDYQAARYVIFSISLLIHRSPFLPSKAQQPLLARTSSLSKLYEHTQIQNIR
jgi:hypothetical protein